MIAGETSQAYNEIVTINLVSVPKNLCYSLNFFWKETLTSAEELTQILITQ